MEDPGRESRPGAGADPGGIAGFAPAAGAEPVPGYRLVAWIGGGGSGEVWKAVGPDGRPLALKLIRLREEDGPGDRRRREEFRRVRRALLRSLEVMAGVRHPDLLATVGAWRIDGWLVLGMELADRTLLQRVDEAVRDGLPGIPFAELIDYMRPAARAIDHLNQPRHGSPGSDGGGVGIQHRDIKPQNLLLVGGRLKVGDFGLAKTLEETTATSGTLTPAYAAPEFFAGESSPRSDQYSLAVTYCQARGGRLPFAGNRWQMMKGHLEEAPDLSMLPEEERPVLARALAKRPEDRWPDCQTFVDLLREAGANGGVSQDAARARPGSRGNPSALSAERKGRRRHREFGRLTRFGVLLLIGAGLAAAIPESVREAGQAVLFRRGKGDKLPGPSSPLPRPLRTTRLARDIAMSADPSSPRADQVFPGGPARQEAPRREDDLAVRSPGGPERTEPAPDRVETLPGDDARVPGARWSATLSEPPREADAPPGSTASRSVVERREGPRTVDPEKAAGPLPQGSAEEPRPGGLAGRVTEIKEPSKAALPALAEPSETEDAPTRNVRQERREAETLVRDEARGEAARVDRPVAKTATIHVLMPDARSELVVRGEVGRGNPDEWYGPKRVVHTPPFHERKAYLVGAFWTDRNGAQRHRTCNLKVDPGSIYEVDLTRPAASARQTGP